MLIGFLSLVFLTGGGSRGDIQSLVILRPVAVLVCGFGLWSLSAEHLRNYRFLFGFAAAVFALTIIHLVPLPPGIWSHLPGREIVVETDRAIGLGKVWRPISLVSTATYNALYSLFIPAAVLILGVQLAREERFRLLFLFAVFGLLSGVLGLLQAVGAPDGPFYLYNITNNGSAVGLFSNRNHQAIFLACQFPILAVFASLDPRTVEKWRFRLWTSIIIGVIFIPLLLVTGSRAGLIIGLFGIAAIATLYRKPVFERPAKRKGSKFNLTYAFIGFGVLALGLLTILFSRAQAFERLIAPDQSEDLRFSVWAPIADMTGKYFPIGSGIGSFEETYQIEEPLPLLSYNYLNHAHNDWLEVAMTAGLPGLALLLIAVLAWAKASYSAWQPNNNVRSRDTIYARLASLIILMLAMGSFGDYPLRVPSIASFFVIAALWLCGERWGGMPRGRGTVNGGGTPSDSPLAA